MAETLDVVDLLIDEHRTIESLLDRFDRELDPGELCRLFARLVEEITAHEAVEQQVLFPSFCSVVPGAECEAMERLAEHQEINELLAEMHDLDPRSPGFEKRASALVLDLHRHLELEEEEVFPKLRAALGHDQLVALADRARMAVGRLNV